MAQDSKNQFDNKSVNPGDVLNVFANGRIGELITEVVGDDQLQTMFEDHPDYQQEKFEGKPSGIIALDLGIVNKDMKNALLVAQAAARTIAVVDGNMDAISIEDDVFKFVGSEGDPALLKESQANWQVANGMEHDDESRNVFKTHASAQIANAAQIFKREGFDKEAIKLDALAQSSRPSKPVVGDLSPSNYAAKMFFDQKEANTGRYGSEVYNMGENSPAEVILERKLDKLMTLCSISADKEFAILERTRWNRTLNND